LPPKSFRIIFIVKTFIIFASLAEGTPILFDKNYKQAFWKAENRLLFQKVQHLQKWVFPFSKSMCWFSYLFIVIHNGYPIGKKIYFFLTFWYPPCIMVKN
jgi:hypothetical protein